MSQKINFVKMHGLGNDFVIINRRDLPNNCNLQQLSLVISNRRTGIGCDQFIIYDKKNAHYEMTIYNQDGSIAKLCGNASRCVAKLIYLDLGQKKVTLKINGKELFCQISGENDISVDVGIVSFQENWMPPLERIWSIMERYVIDLKEVIYADIGNPHLVIFSNLSDQDKEIVGTELQKKGLFEEGINVNFASVKNNKIYLSVWERGAGLTLACGSGACASFASAIKLGFITDPCEVIFALGSLKMSKHGENIIMTGSANLVANGEFIYE